MVWAVPVDMSLNTLVVRRLRVVQQARLAPRQSLPVAVAEVMAVVLSQ